MYIISLFKKLYILLSCSCVLINIIIFLKKKKHTWHSGNFLFRAHSFVLGHINQAKKKPYASPNQQGPREKQNPNSKHCQEESSTCYCRKESMTIEFVTWPTMRDNGPNQSRPSFRGPINSLSLRWSPRVCLQGNSYTEMECKYATKVHVKFIFTPLHQSPTSRLMP